MSVRAAKSWLWNYGWTVAKSELRAAFPSGMPTTVRELQAWAERTLPPPEPRPWAN